MRTSSPASWMYAESFHAEPMAVARARAQADEMDCVPVSQGVAAYLRVLAASTGARSAVELGTGTGVSGLALLQGMAPDGILTTIDIEMEHQHAARDLFNAFGIRANRARTIVGNAAAVLPRLADGVYDLVFVDADKAGLDSYVDQALRLLRVGGTLVIDNALWRDQVADPAQRDAQTTAIRDVGKRLRDDERLVSALLPVGDGLLVATKRS